MDGARVKIEQDESRDRANVTEHHIENTAYTQYPGNYYRIDDSFNEDEFRQSARVCIHKYDIGEELEIDIFGIGPAIANAYRRIMIAEVPTMAFELCFMYNNTSVIQDEMLAHRIGMIPIKVDPTKFEFRPDYEPAETTSKRYTIIFDLREKCEKLPDVEKLNTGRRQDLYKNYKIYSKHLKWQPQGDLGTRFKGKNAIRPVHEDILIAKLREGQEIVMTAHANKGIGRDHAKFSPVATATYKLMPDIQLQDKISGSSAVKLMNSFSKGVIELDGPEQVARVANARLDSGSRNVFRHAELKDKVKYDLIKDYYIFKIESAGAIPAIDILLQACDILEAKCQHFVKVLETSDTWVGEPPLMVKYE